MDSRLLALLAPIALGAVAACGSGGDAKTGVPPILAPRILLPPAPIRRGRRTSPRVRASSRRRDARGARAPRATSR